MLPVMTKDTGEILLAHELLREGKIRVRNMFPAAFTMICVLFFMIPCYLAVYAARHPVVRYFTGEWYYILAFIPVLIAIVHNFHVHNGPNKSVTNLALLVPNMLLLVYGTNMLTSASSKADMLFSIDCNTMVEKAHLQQEWEAAHSLYRSCLKQTAASRNVTTSFLATHFRIQDCSEYAPALQHHSREWSYLQYLEGKHACSGFCIPGEPLWSTGSHKDACAIEVSSVFRNVVKGNFMQVVALSLVTLCLDVVAVAFLGSMLKSNGFEF